VSGVAVVTISMSPADTFHDDKVHVAIGEVKKKRRNTCAARTGLKMFLLYPPNGDLATNIAKKEPIIAT
jgi:hypothetical protein